MEQAPPLTRPAPALWTLTDGHAGNLRQARALAWALDLGPTREVTLHARAPWKWASPRRLPGSERAFGPAFAGLLRTPPALAIGCGRQAALATRLLRARGARTVQILDPRLPPQHWDWVIAPAHDGLAGDNVIAVQGSLNDIDDAWLERARSTWPNLGGLPGVRTAVLIGGPSAHMAFDVAAVDALAAQLTVLLADGPLLVTASRRTPPEVRQWLRQRFATRTAVLWIDDSDGDNPYAGLLGWADRIVCTPDSVNMLSEACATRVPVYVFEPGRLGGRPRAFVDALMASGRVRPMSEARAEGGGSLEAQPLRETARVAALLRERLGGV
jgi:mitochondrial fission protein ELM1